MGSTQGKGSDRSLVIIQVKVLAGQVIISSTPGVESSGQEPGISDGND